MTLSSLIKILAIYAIFALITYGFIQRERQDVGAAGQGARAKSMFWALIWPIYWLAVVGPKTSLNHAAKFLTHNMGFWAFYLLGIPASFAVFVYCRWDDGLLFSQGAWILFKSLCMAIFWPVFLFI